MRRTQIGVGLIAIMFCSTFVPVHVRGADDSRSAPRITFTSCQCESLAENLGIFQKEGTVEFRTPQLRLTLLLEFYKDGKKAPGPADFRVTRQSDQAIGGYKTVQFSLHVIDLDRLKLGDGQPGHCRYRIKLADGRGNAWGMPADVPKTVFNSSEIRTVGELSHRAGDDGKVPLFWIAGRTADQRTPSSGTTETIDDVVRNYPKTEFAIVSLLVDPVPRTVRPDHRVSRR